MDFKDVTYKEKAEFKKKQRKKIEKWGRGGNERAKGGEERRGHP